MQLETMAAKRAPLADPQLALLHSVSSPVCQVTAEALRDAMLAADLLGRQYLAEHAAGSSRQQPAAKTNGV